MPDIMDARTLTANQRYRPFAEGGLNWRFRRCPYPRGLYSVAVRTTGAAGTVYASVMIGTTEILQRSPVSVGGTAGVMPTPDGATSTPFHQFVANGGDEIDLLIEETAGVTPAITLWANVEPAS